MTMFNRDFNRFLSISYYNPAYNGNNQNSMRIHTEPAMKTMPIIHMEIIKITDMIRFKTVHNNRKWHGGRNE